MGHGVSCARTGDEHDYFRAAQVGDLDALGALLAADPSLARRATLYDRLSALHIAAANGRLEVPPLPPALLCSAMLCSPFIHGWLLSQLPASQPPRSPLSISFLQVLSMVLDHGVPPDAVNRHKQVRDPNPIDAYFSPSPLQRISPGLPASKSAPFFFTASNQIKGQKSHLFSPACFSLSRLR